MEKKKSVHLIGSILCGVLSAFGIVTSAISLIGGSSGLCALGDGVIILIFLSIAYYTFIGYKKPHGNLLQYILLAPVILALLFIPSLVQNGNTAGIVSLTACTGMIWCIAGRLSKIKENLVFIIFVTFCGTYGIILGILSSNITFGTVTHIIIWLDTCVAYLLRYKEHIEAGLASDESKK